MIDERYLAAINVCLVMDNLDNHSVTSLYQTFPPEEARRLAEMFGIHHTPNHGSSRLNMVEIELSILKGQCPDQRIADMTTMQPELTAW